MNLLKKHLYEISTIIPVVETYVFSENKVLMLKRSENKKKFPGFWAVPGGHIDSGETPVTAAIREIYEETGISLNIDQIHLKVIAIHTHLDRNETYQVFIYNAKYSTAIAIKPSIEGNLEWLEIEKLQTLENVLPPVKYYFDHILNHKPGILYNSSIWENNELNQVLDERLEVNLLPNSI